MNNDGSSNWDTDDGNDNELNTNEFTTFFAAGAAACFAYPFISRTPSMRRHRSALSTVRRVEELLTGDPATMFNKVRMHAETFRRLGAVLQERGLLSSSRCISVHEQLFIFLTIVCQVQTNRESQDAWQLSAETISRWFTEVLTSYL